MRRAAVLLLAAACGDSGTGSGSDSGSGTNADEAPVWFVEEAEARGLAFRHESGAAGEYLMPEIMGGGAALFDADGDGDLDAYLVQGGGVRTPRDERSPNRLFANDGAGFFTDVTESAGGSDAGERGYGMGVACGDVDGDGRTDLYVTNVGADALLSNDSGAGQLRFRDVTAEARIDVAGWSTSAAFLDADNDGDLDLYVVRYVVWHPDQELACANDLGSEDYCSPTAYGAPALDRFLENAGDGTFRDASARAGVEAFAGNGLGIACADFDRDGWTDVFVANDQDPDLLWRNARDGTFRDESFRAGVALDRDGKAKAGMGVAVADVDEDGDEDLLVCNLRRESDSFFDNRGSHFLDRTSSAGLGSESRSYTRFGLGWADFDQDGRLDLYQASGRVMRRLPEHLPSDPYAEPNLLLRGVAGGRFEVVPGGGTGAPHYGTSRAAAFGDVDGDGGIDVLIVDRDAPARLLMNRVEGRGNWIALSILDAAGAPALHATAEITAGSRSLRAEVRAASSYLASSSPVIHVGLGDATTVERVRVRFPDGVEVVVGPLAAGERHDLVHPDGR